MLYPATEPIDHGMLEVGDGHQLYWQICGNPHGIPAVVLHGGPGSGCTPGWRRYFNPDRYRVALFDQRGCGRSTPHAATPDIDLSSNTTHHLLADLERLRRHLAIDRWLVLGASWGCVLGLAYAQAHPDRVSAMVLTGLATGRRAETDLLTRGLGRLFPDAWAAFLQPIPADERTGDLAVAYSRLLHHPDPAIRAHAANSWCDWENAIVPTSAPNPRYDDPAFRLGFARLVTHYWRHGSWLADEQILAHTYRLAAIPAILVQGALDLGNLVGTPWQLHSAWSSSELHLINDAGHDAGTPTIADTLAAATDRFARTL